jgi:hypothetical protein
MKRPGSREKVRNEPFGDDDIGIHDMPSFARETSRLGRGRSKGRNRIAAPLDPLAPLDPATANYGGP